MKQEEDKEPVVSVFQFLQFLGHLVGALQLLLVIFCKLNIPGVEVENCENRKLVRN